MPQLPSPPSMEIQTPVQELPAVINTSVRPAPPTDVSKSVPAAVSAANAPGAPATASQPHYGKNFYPYVGTLPAIAVPDVTTAKLDGFVKISHPKQDEPTITITNLELESRIQTDRDALELAKNLFARLEEAKKANPQSVTDMELKDAQKEVQRSENELAQDLAKEDLGNVKAPNKGAIIDWETFDGAHVRVGAPLYSSFDGDRVSLYVYLPTGVHSDDFKLTLDGKPVRSIESYHWLPTPWSSDPTSKRGAHLSLIVTPSEPIAQGQKVSVSLEAYYPDNDFKKLLDSIVVKGSPTKVEVPKVKPYYISATADGSITYLAREGDKVKAGQIGAHIDAKPVAYGRTTSTGKKCVQYY